LFEPANLLSYVSFPSAGTRPDGLPQRAPCRSIFNFGFVFAKDVSGSLNLRVAAGALAAVLATGAVSVRLSAQAAAGTGAALAEGWAALAAGDTAKAGRAADRAMNETPRSAAAVALAVEVDVARGGKVAGLDTYERWLAGRRVDDAYVLRRIAQAHLRAIARTPKVPGYVEALKALAADGDADAGTELASAMASGNPQASAALAATGNRPAIEALITRLQGPGGNKLAVIDALAESRSALAVPPLVQLLRDPREEHRAAAADALGRMGAATAVPQIKALMTDPVPPVRIAAAGALYRLQDFSGVNMLEELLNSEHASARLSAAEIMAGTPPPSWQGIVKALLTEPDEGVQLGAARLIAPYDPQAAAETLERLGRSENLTVREEAARAYMKRVAGDFASLRRYLRSQDTVASVRAADRILELTR